MAASDPDAMSHFYDNDVEGARNANPLDPWGNEYWVEALPDGGQQLVSCGPDEAEGTEDDIFVLIEQSDR